MFAGDFVNEFSWSKSRHAKFEECRRLYFHHYYGSWGGWRDDAPRRARESYVLKSLCTRQQWAGRVVHEHIAFALALARSGATPPADQLVARAHARMRDDFLLSRKGAYRARPKWTVGLLEHEYQQTVTAEEWRANWDNAEACLRGFCASSWLSRACALERQAWLPIDEVGSFFLEGTKVFAGPDFAFREGEGVVLVDWKTGVPREDDRGQVQGYALYARSQWGVAPHKVTARLSYLAAAQEQEVRVDAAALESFIALFRASVAGMRGLLRDPAANLAVQDDFVMTTELARCRECAFRRLCSRQ
jgi:CRISPR/Cas system-associated exonuclease Cas4 (RecB family)